MKAGKGSASALALITVDKISSKKCEKFPQNA
jgi:hypothetical protein